MVPETGSVSNPHPCHDMEEKEEAYLGWRPLLHVSTDDLNIQYSSILQGPLPICHPYSGTSV